MLGNRTCAEYYGSLSGLEPLTVESQFCEKNQQRFAVLLDFSNKDGVPVLQMLGDLSMTGYFELSRQTPIAYRSSLSSTSQLTKPQLNHGRICSGSEELGRGKEGYRKVPLENPNAN